MDVKAQHGQDASTNIFLTAAVVLANVDYSGLLEYGLKAVIGGVIWMGFKLAGEQISNAIRNRKAKK